MTNETMKAIRQRAQAGCPTFEDMFALITEVERVKKDANLLRKVYRALKAIGLADAAGRSSDRHRHSLNAALAKYEASL